MPRGSRPGERRGGRAPGTPNRRTRELADRLADLGCDPVEGLVRIANAKGTPVALRASVLAGLMPFLYPKRKSIALELQPLDPFAGLTTEDLTILADGLRASFGKDCGIVTP